jgi:hypothetical protein
MLVAKVDFDRLKEQLRQLPTAADQKGEGAAECLLPRRPNRGLARS